MSVEKEIRKILAEATPASVRAKQDLVRSGLGHDKNASAVMKALENPEASMKNPAKREMLLKVMQDLLDVVVNDQSMMSKTKTALRKEEVEEIEEKLVGGQKKIDVNKNGKLDAEDFKKLRMKKEEEEKAEQMIEAKKSKKDEEDDEEENEDEKESKKAEKEEEEADEKDMTNPRKNFKGFKKGMKEDLQLEQAPVAPAPVKHRIAVTVSEPDHPMVTKRKEQTLKHVIVNHGPNKESAQKLGEKFYKKRGYKVHGSEHAGIKEEVELDESVNRPQPNLPSMSSDQAVANAQNAVQRQKKYLELLKAQDKTTDYETQRRKKENPIPKEDGFLRSLSMKNEAAFGKDKAANLKAALDRHSEKAIAANKSGDDMAVKVHQSKMNMLKNKMAKMSKNESVTTDYNMVKGQTQNKNPTKKLATDYTAVIRNIKTDKTAAKGLKEGYSEDDIANGGTVIYKHEGKHHISKVSHKTGGSAGTKVHTASKHVVPLHKVVSTDKSDWNKFKNAAVKEEINQIYELKKTTLKSYLQKKTNKPGVPSQKDVSGMANATVRLMNKKPTSEDVQIDEVSQKTVSDYKAKASEYIKKYKYSNNPPSVQKKLAKRTAGSMRADVRMKEEIEQLDELSPATKASYVAKAKDQIKQSIPYTKKGEEYRDIAKNFIKKREKGIAKANEAKDPREYDYEGDMAKSQLRSIMANAKQAHDMLKDDTNMAEWVQSKITLAADYISTVADYMQSEVNEDKNDYRRKIEKNNKNFIAASKRQKNPLTNVHTAKTKMKPVKEEEEEQIDELKKSTLGSYVKKASKEYGRDKQLVGRESPSGMVKDARPEVKVKLKNRMAGIEKAADRLAKEETQVNEAFPTVDDAKKRMKDALKSKFDKKKISTGTVYTKKYKEEPENEKMKPVKEEEQIDEATPYYNKPSFMKRMGNAAKKERLEREKKEKEIEDKKKSNK